MNNFEEELKDLLNSLENKELLITLKENFIFMVRENLDFNEEYKEDSKELYFKSFKNHIDLLSHAMDKQMKISNLELSELYKVSEYQSNKDILHTLEWSVEYLRNNYIEIDLCKDTLIKNNLEKNMELDLEKICIFLDRNIRKQIVISKT